jgi:hypothetical protein
MIDICVEKNRLFESTGRQLLVVHLPQKEKYEFKKSNL